MDILNIIQEKISSFQDAKSTLKFRLIRIYFVNFCCKSLKLDLLNVFSVESNFFQTISQIFNMKRIC